MWISNFDLCGANLPCFTSLRLLGFLFFFLFPFLKPAPSLGLSLISVFYKKLLNVNFIFKPEPVEASGYPILWLFSFLCCELTEESEHHPLLVHRGKENGEWGRGTYLEYLLCASTVLSDLNALVSFQFTRVTWVIVTLTLQKKTDSLWWARNRTGVESFIWLALMDFPLDHLGHTPTLSAKRRNWTR